MPRPTNSLTQKAVYQSNQENAYFSDEHQTKARANIFVPLMLSATTRGPDTLMMDPSASFLPDIEARHSSAAERRS